MNLQGIFQRARRRGQGRLLVLAYEGVDAARDRRPGIDTREFLWQIEQVAARFAPIDLARAARHLGGKNVLEGPQLCVTVHSDSMEDWQAAFPVLQRFGVPATLFVSLGDERENGCDGGADADWQSVREFAAVGAGVAFRFDAGSDLLTAPSAQRRSRIALMRNRLEQNGGIQVRAFAYPGDGHGQQALSLIYDAAVAGLSLGLCGAEGINALRPMSPMMLKRATITPRTTRAQFQSLIEPLGRGE